MTHVIGGGITGLTAAIALAERGRKVRLHEQTRHLGGRAATTQDRGYSLNLGPHALYRGGAAYKQFKSWGIAMPGAVPKLDGDSFLVMNAEKYRFPASTAGLMLTGALSAAEKIAAAKLMGAVRSAAPRGESLSAWLDAQGVRGRARLLIEALIRLGTFAADPGILAADAALAQFRLALTEGVLYIDGGWETLVKGLEAKARAVGVEIVMESPVNSLPPGSDGVVVATNPEQTAKLTLWSPPAMEAARMATLDLGLRRVREGWAKFAIGLDCPMYLSRHSDTARVAPEGRAMVHVAKYLGPSDAASREQLEAFADLLMPGWRDEAEVVRYLPNMTVTHALPTVEGRPAVEAAGEGVAIAGEWVGSEGMLTDAAVASAVRAAGRVRDRSLTVAAQ